MSLLYFNQAKQRNVSLSCHIFEHFSPASPDGSIQLLEDGVRDVMVYVDRNKMSQVIHNLVSNAIKFTPPGGQITVIATVEVASPLPADARIECDGTVLRRRSHFAAEYVKVTVTDTGAGLTQVRYWTMSGCVLRKCVNIRSLTTRWKI